MQSYEVEVKSLLGNPERAEVLRARLRELDPAVKILSRNKQLNHYFVGGNIAALAQATDAHLSTQAKVKIDDLAARAKEFSVRTREKDGEVLLVVKCSVGDDTSANGVARMEFEEKVSLALLELDQLVLSAGFDYQAKWSREREEYLCRDINICLDRNAGYGWLAEFEKVVEAEAEVALARQEIAALMAECGASELPQDRLERMFAFYNAHWPEYYGTENIFIIE